MNVFYNISHIEINYKVKKFYWPLEYLTKKGQNNTNNLALRVVIELCEPYFRANRNVTFDNYFTSPEVEKLLLQKGRAIVSTMRKNKA